MGPSPKTLLLSTAALALSANATTTPLTERSILKRDPPTALPGCATDNDEKFQSGEEIHGPTNGVNNATQQWTSTQTGATTPPRSPQTGPLATGLDYGGAKNEDCHDLSDLQNNVYSRARCNNGWCGYIHGYYFEKDQSIDGSCGVGRKNDCEHIAVWVQDGADMPAYVGVSQHGSYLVRAAADVPFDGTHPKVVYNQDGILTHDFRFDNEDEDHIENATGAWFYGDLVGYDGFPTDDLRGRMLNNDWGAALPDIRDGVFEGKLELAKGGNDIPLDTSVDENSPGEPVGC